MDDFIRIECLENGYEVECLDPKIAEQNAKGKGIYEDPYKAYAFSTAEEVVKFVQEKLKTMKPSGNDEYSKAFKEAASKKS